MAEERKLTQDELDIQQESPEDREKRKEAADRLEHDLEKEQEDNCPVTC